MILLSAFVAFSLLQEGGKLAGHTDEVLCLAASPDGKTLLSGSKDGELKFWDLTTQKCTRTTFKSGGAMPCLAFSPDGKFLAIGMERKRVYLYDPEEQEDRKVLDGADGPIRSVAFSSEGTRIYLIASGDKRLYVWKPDEKGFPEKHEHESEVLAFALSRDGKQMATAVGSGLVRVFRTDPVERVHQLDQGGVPTCLTFSADGKRLASGGANGVRIWDLASGSATSTFKPIPFAVNCLAFSLDGKSLAIGSEKGEVSLLDSRTGVVASKFGGHDGPVTALAMLPDGKTLASASRDKTIRLWLLK